jgi:hypothetical protein
VAVRNPANAYERDVQAVVEHITNNKQGIISLGNAEWNNTNLNAQVARYNKKQKGRLSAAKDNDETLYNSIGPNLVNRMLDSSGPRGVYADTLARAARQPPGVVAVKDEYDILIILGGFRREGQVSHYETALKYDADKVENAKITFDRERETMVLANEPVINNPIVSLLPTTEGNYSKHFNDIFVRPRNFPRYKAPNSLKFLRDTRNAIVTIKESPTAQTFFDQCTLHRANTVKVSGGNNEFVKAHMRWFLSISILYAMKPGANHMDVNTLNKLNETKLVNL